MKKMWLGVLTGALMLMGLTTPVLAVDCGPGAANPGASTYAECNLVKDDSLWPTIFGIIDVIVGVLGVVAVIVVILGGVMYTTSAGDASKAKKAKDTIMYGIIGLVVAILAFAIVNFVAKGLVTAGGSGGGSSSGGSGDSSETTSDGGSDSGSGGGSEGGSGDAAD